MSNISLRYSVVLLKYTRISKKNFWDFNIYLEVSGVYDKFWFWGIEI